MRIPRPSNFVLGLLLGVVLGASGTATAAVLTPRNRGRGRLSPDLGYY